MPKINKEEYEILKGLDDKWEWIARDDNYGGSIFCFREKPHKYIRRGGWSPDTTQYKYLGEYDLLFQFIQWEDEEPYSITELIEEYEEGSSYEFGPLIDTGHGHVVSKIGWLKESEETEVKKDIEWLKKEVEKRIEKIKTDEVSFAGSDYLDEGYIHGMRDVQAIANQLDEPEVLSQEWIDANSKLGAFTYSNGIDIGYFVKVGALEDKIVPKQEEANQAYKDGYEKGKQHATEKQSEETETVARVLVDYLIASAKLKLALNMEVKELEE